MIRCPACGESARAMLVNHEVSIEQHGRVFRAYQDHYECPCGERWSTTEQCAAADTRLIEQGWKPRGAR